MNDAGLIMLKADLEDGSPEIDPNERIGDWTVGRLWEFVSLVSVAGVTMPKAGMGISFKELMKDFTPWEDERDVEEIIREIYEGRTMGRGIEL